MFNKYAPLSFQKSLNISDHEKDVIFALFDEVVRFTGLNKNSKKIKTIKIIPGSEINADETNAANFVNSSPNNELKVIGEYNFKNNTVAIDKDHFHNKNIWYHEFAHALDYQFGFSIDNTFGTIVEDYQAQILNLSLNDLYDVSFAKTEYITEPDEIFANGVACYLSSFEAFQFKSLSIDPKWFDIENVPFYVSDYESHEVTMNLLREFSGFVQEFSYKNFSYSNKLMYDLKDAITKLKTV